MLSHSVRLAAAASVLVAAGGWYLAEQLRQPHSVAQAAEPSPETPTTKGPPSATASATTPSTDEAALAADPAVRKTLPKTDDEWKKTLTPEQYHVLREHGTERAFTGALHNSKQPGTFRCAGCGVPLFTSDTKFDSGTGWPSFWQPIDGVKGKRVAEKLDISLFSQRTEVHCSRCGGHLGHVFSDGPQPTGLRYCINSVSLKLEPKAAADAKQPEMKKP